ASTQDGDAPLSVDFTGSTSIDDVGVVSYFWDFKDGNTSTLADPSNIFNAAGSYDVELTVTDAENETDTATITVTVNEAAGNQPPSAIATASVQSGTTPLLVDFTGSNSIDDVGVVSYFWDFKDGNTSTLADPSNTFGTAGSYDVELTVTDAENETDTATLTITVSDPSTEGVIGLTLVDAVTNNDLFGLFEGQQLDFGSSGGTGLNVRADTNPSTVGSVSLVLTGPVSTSRTEGVAPYALFGDVSGNYNLADLPLGDYTITATAFNGGGQSGGILGQPLVVNFSVVDDQGGVNLPPTAIATASTQNGDAPLSVDFTGSNSIDDVGVVSYFWDFKDGNTSTLADPNNTFTSAGTYDVELTVTDAENETDTDTITVTV
ncbi:PKD domain-containing protein, partial [Muricauda sp. 2012CJ35-5]